VRACFGGVPACSRRCLRRNHRIKEAEILFGDTVLRLRFSLYPRLTREYFSTRPALVAVMQAAMRTGQSLSCDEPTAITGVSPPPPGNDR
jgi:hypothetical protein